MKKIASIVMALTLSACASGISILPEKAPKMDLPAPAPIVLQPVNVEVLQGKTLQDACKTATPDTAYFAFTPDEYTHLGQNLVEIKRYVEQTKTYIDLSKQK